MNDETIVELYWQRQERAITETQKKYGPYLHQIANNILQNREDSQESVNDTYLAAWNSIPPHRPQILRAYLVKLIRRIAIDCYRKRNRDRRKDDQYALSLDELSDCIPSNSTQEALDEKLLAEAIGQYLRTLPKMSRVAFVGRYYYLDSLREVADYCHMTESKLKSLLFRLRKGLRDYLIKEGYNL
ncbi:MAG: sigma-70 family RNA polymerase sigma factor [Ruminococcaceae bacterium]|nr:sigma-70 family RNA polymerase sigma factor [Oscillospiraceae bacterium]